MATERVLSNLNLISFKTESGLQNHIDELQEGDLAFTPDNSLKGILLDFKWADHLLNDISWLRADTFSWHDGEMYKAAYNHLVADFEGTTAETETIGNIEITFYRAEDKHKICLPDQESNIAALYESTGVAWYYILDTANKQFKLPRSKHNKYADTVPVVGNNTNIGWTDGTTEYIGKVETYTGVGTTTIFATGDAGQLPNNNGSGIVYDMNNKGYGLTTDPEKSGIIAQQAQDTDQYKYLYFYVGNFERDALEQTAGVTTETLNGKADSDLKNIPANYDYVVESQMPTEANGYTWYRKYKSGWVEQGGVFTVSTGGDAVSITYPVEMSNTNYCALLGETDNNTNNTYIQLRFYSKTTTGASIYANLVGNHTNSWWVSGMSA